MADTPDLTAADPTADPAPATPAIHAPIVARPGGEYRLKRMLLVVLFVGYGAWSCYDGFYKMPRDNAAAAAKGLKKLPHPAYDIPFNQGLGLALPPLGLLLAGWSFYNSRGHLRLDPDDVLHVPGHPPVPLSTVTAVDRGKWDRKGIAQVDYQLPDGTTDRLTLDDFLYQRTPTDQIFDRVLAAVEAPAVGGATPSEGAA